MRIQLFTAAVLFAFSLQAQEHFCGATDVQNKWFAAHPDLKARFDELQRQADARDKEFFSGKNAQMRTSTSPATYTIPVVFHILHTGGAENIQDAQVNDAVSILNRDFRKQNADTSVVVNAFKNIIGDAKIEFRLATKDPAGNCTNGIIRHWDANTDWDSNNFFYYNYTWDPTMYLNIYVVKTINSNAAGYTFLPGSGIPDEMDAIVILSTYVGSIGTGNTFTSRALTHEVGHWFDLPHVWGGTNQPGVSCGDDGVTDTPVTQGYSTCNLTSTLLCTPGVPENVQNYMDYSYCSRMFTIGQGQRMQNAASSIVSGRNNLSSPTNLAATGITNPGVNCVPEMDIAASVSLACSGHSLSLMSYTYNAGVSSYVWSANNGATVVNPSAATTPLILNNLGITTITCVASNANGSVVRTMTVNALDGSNKITLSNVESFEASTLPAMWNVVNPNTPTLSWAMTTDGASSGSKSMYVAGENMLANSIEILETPSYDFKNNPGAQFTFYYAYAKASSFNKDKFKVQASRNCGGTWTDIWTPNNTMLANASVGIMPTVFIAGANGWVLEDMTPLPQFFPFLSEDNVRFRFYFQEDVGGTGFGNRFYLDQVNFTTPVGINEVTRSIGFNVYPNPSEAVFNVNFTLAQPAKIKYQVLSVSGAVVLSEAERSFNEGSHEIAINQNNQLAKGMYLLSFEMNGVKMSRKLVVN